MNLKDEDTVVAEIMEKEINFWVFHIDSIGC
jgi:hypothetical protein